jgi:hypothetical protein
MLSSLIPVLGLSLTLFSPPPRPPPLLLLQELVQQRMQRYDPSFCAQCFDQLLHVIGRLQAPYRRQHTQQQYAEVGAAFASAAATAAATAPQAAPAKAQGLGASAGAAASPPAAAVDEASVAAVVAAARFLLRQLEELNADVARAHLAILKGGLAVAPGGAGSMLSPLEQEALHSGSPGEVSPVIPET